MVGLFQDVFSGIFSQLETIQQQWLQLNQHPTEDSQKSEAFQQLADYIKVLMERFDPKYVRNFQFQAGFQEEISFGLIRD